MSFFDFLDKHTDMAMILLVFGGPTALAFVWHAFKLATRSVNIVFRGWPPPHVDADGDLAEHFRKDKK